METMLLVLAIPEIDRAQTENHYFDDLKERGFEFTRVETMDAAMTLVLDEGRVYNRVSFGGDDLKFAEAKQILLTLRARSTVACTRRERKPTPRRRRAP
jgi:hypothetical protein